MKTVYRSDGKMYSSVKRAALDNGISQNYMSQIIDTAVRIHGFSFSFTPKAPKVSSDKAIKIEPPHGMHKSDASRPHLKFATICPVCQRWTYRVSGFCAQHEHEAEKYQAYAKARYA